MPISTGEVIGMPSRLMWRNKRQNAKPLLKASVYATRYAGKRFKETSLYGPGLGQPFGSGASATYSGFAETSDAP